MAYFIGNIVPAAYARLVRFFSAKPEYMTFKKGSQIHSLLVKAADIMDDGIRNDSNPLIPLTGVTGTIDYSEFDMIAGGRQTATITPAKVPSNADAIVVYTYDSSAEEVVMVEDGEVTAMGVGTATITLGIEGTLFKKEFAITVVDTTV